MWISTAEANKLAWHNSCLLHFNDFTLEQSQHKKIAQQISTAFTRDISRYFDAWVLYLVQVFRDNFVDFLKLCSFITEMQTVTWEVLLLPSIFASNQSIILIHGFLKQAIKIVQQSFRALNLLDSLPNSWRCIWRSILLLLDSCKKCVFVWLQSLSHLLHLEFLLLESLL